MPEHLSGLRWPLIGRAGDLERFGGHVTEYFDDAPTAATATPIAATAGQVTAGVDAALAAQAPPGTGAHLVGNVAADSSGGGELEGVAVIALHANTFALAAGDVTDADGNYDIEVGLGGYRLLFYDPSGDHQAEWFNNAPLGDVGASGIVTATASQPTKRRDVSLAPNGGVVAGTVTDATTGDPIEGAWAVTIAPNGRLRVALTGPDGRYRRTRAATGNNRVTFVSPDGGYTQQFWDDAPTAATASILNIIAGDTVTGIDAALQPST